MAAFSSTCSGNYSAGAEPARAEAVVAPAVRVWSGVALLALGCSSAAAQNAADARRFEAALVEQGSARVQGVKWSPHPVEGLCYGAPGRPAAPLPALLVVASELEHVQAFCTRSSVDWSRHRLAVYSDSNGVQVWVEDVVRDGAELVLVLRRSSGAGCAYTWHGFQYWRAAALIPAGSERVRSFTQDGALPCSKASDGFGY